MKIKKAQKEYIFSDDRPFKSCHASTVVQLEENEYFVAWFAGTAEGEKDVDIWCARKKNGKWTPPYKICGEDGIPHWNPVLFKDDNGILYLYYKVGHTIPEWCTRVIESKDGGYTWSEPKELVPGDIGGRGPVRNKPIILRDGTWLAPASLEKGKWDVFVDISKDQGKTWRKSNRVALDPTIKGEGIIQPTLWESSPNQVHMLMRSSEGRIYRSDSTDGGLTWGEAYPTPLPNNNSGIDLTQMENGNLVLTYNPVAENWGPRTPLVISYSLDNGETWHGEFPLETNEGEYSYPAIISSGNKTFITYTWNRERIAFWEIEWE